MSSQDVDRGMLPNDRQKMADKLWQLGIDPDL
jgi:hypothetical protein